MAHAVRIVSTSLLAFLLSLLAGGLVAQVLAVATHAGEEYIIVFVGVVVFGTLFTLPFLFAQFRADAPGAVDIAAQFSFALAVLFTLALVGFEIWINRSDFAVIWRDLPVVAGLFVPLVVVIVVQWLFVRWRVARRIIVYPEGIQAR